jgi:hypothetical protein
MFNRKKKKTENHNIPFQNLLYITLAINLISMAFVFLAEKHLPTEVPLYYGLVESESQLASSLNLIIPAAVAMTITVINLALMYLLENKFLSKALAITSFTTSVFATITIFKIAFLVGSF